MEINYSGLDQLYDGVECQVWTGLDDASRPVVVYVAGIQQASKLLDVVERLRQKLLRVPKQS